MVVEVPAKDGKVVIEKAFLAHISPNTRNYADIEADDGKSLVGVVVREKVN